MIKRLKRNRKGKLKADIRVPRDKLREIMSILPTEYIWEKENVAPVVEYLDVIKTIQSYILIDSNFGCVQTNKLSERQSTLSDTILRYLVNGAYDKIDEIYHELYDFIDNRRDEKEFLDYAEILILKRLVDTIIYTLEKEISINNILKRKLKRLRIENKRLDFRTKY